MLFNGKEAIKDFTPSYFLKCQSFRSFGSCERISILLYASSGPVLRPFFMLWRHRQSEARDSNIGSNEPLDLVCAGFSRLHRLG